MSIPCAGLSFLLRYDYSLDDAGTLTWAFERKGIFILGKSYNCYVPK